MTIHSWYKANRYYRINLCQDLFGDWVIIRAWGSLTSRAGRVVSEWVTDEWTGQRKVSEISKKRLAHGYVKSLIN